MVIRNIHLQCSCWEIDSLRSILFIALSLCVFAVSSAEPAYKVERGAFVTPSGVIPAGCFAQLVTELNGDNSVAAIFLERASLRGCIDANFPYPGGEEKEVTYSIEQQTGTHDYNLKVCQVVHGSMGSVCDKIIVRFSVRKYLLPDGSKDVLSLVKLGEW